MSRAEPIADVPGARAGPASWRAARRWLRDALLAEQERWPVWLPALVGAGIAVYFALPEEPPRFVAAGCVGGTALLAVMLRRRAAAPAAVAILACAIGFGAAVWRTDQVAAPVLPYRIGPLPIEGRVIAITDVAGGGASLVLDRIRLVGRHPSAIPERARLRMRGRQPAPAVGARVHVLGVLMPPPPPAAPDAYDFGRTAWFARIGAVGYVMGAVEVIAPPEAGFAGPAVRLTRARHDMNLAIRAALGPPAGAIAAAVLTGDESGVDSATNLALRDAGLGHLLSISGLHMAMVAGILFFVVRGGLALIPPIALRHPIKKWAALAALLGAFGYLLLSGSSYPAQRSFLMTAAGLGAVMIDRSPISMRVLAVAAGVLLLATPEALLNVSFQLSFAAVGALIALYEALGARLHPDRSGGFGRRALSWLMASFASGLVCELALAPIAAYQFNRVTVFGAVANLVAIPLFGVWIMPAGILALALLPLGLAGPALTVMGWGIDLLLALAHWVAAWPHAVVPVRSMPPSAFVLIAAGQTWLLLWQRRWRWLGLAPVAAGIALAAAMPPPDMLVARDGRLVAVRGADGALAFSSLRRGAFARDLWLRRDGEPVPPSSGRPARAARCGADPCLFDTPGGLPVAYLTKTPRADFACPAAAILVAAATAGPCRAGRVLIDRAGLATGGAHALWFTSDGGVRVTTVQAERGDRPWSRAEPPRSSRRDQE